MLQSSDRKIALILMVLATLYLYKSYQLPSYSYAVIDADLLPKTLGFLLLLLSLLLFFQAEKRATKKSKDIGLLLVIAGLMLLYIFLLERVGFLLCSILFFMVTTRLLGYKKWKVNFITALLFTLMIYSAFNYLLKIQLPQGILPW